MFAMLEARAVFLGLANSVGFMFAVGVPTYIDPLYTSPTVDQRLTPWVFWFCSFLKMERGNQLMLCRTL